MNKKRINYSWPVTLTTFEIDKANENFSRGKLNVFYKGVTADHRRFSDKFSEELIKTLPYTPIVGHYDEEKGDFVGHATEQEIFGIVDPCTAPEFIKMDDGNTWCVCDVVYYTERPDKVGEWAKKIVGHKQSLELDPDSVKYKVNYDERKHFKDIEFTDGKFVGVSVLGEDQTPAFTNSHFFSVNPDFEEKMKLLEKYCKNNNTKEDGDNKKMDVTDFLTLSFGEVCSKVDEAIALEYENEAFTRVIDMYDDNAIVQWYSFLDGKLSLMRVFYTIDEKGNVSLGKVNEVHVTYEDFEGQTEEVAQTEVEVGSTDATTIAEEAESIESNTEQVSTTEVSIAEEVNIEPIIEAENKIETEGVTLDEEQLSTDDAQTEIFTESLQDVDELKEDVTNEQQPLSNDVEEKEESESSSTSFSESKSDEFETNQDVEQQAESRTRKQELINSYEKFLTVEEFEEFMAKIDELSETELENELLKIYKRKNEEKSSERAFSLNSLLKQVSEKKNDSSLLDDFVRKYNK